MVLALVGYCVISHLAQLFLEEEEGAYTLEGVGGHPCRGAAHEEEGVHPKELELKKKSILLSKKVDTIQIANR